MGQVRLAEPWEIAQTREPSMNRNTAILVVLALLVGVLCWFLFVSKAEPATSVGTSPPEPSPPIVEPAVIPGPDAPLEAPARTIADSAPVATIESEPARSDANAERCIVFGRIVDTQGVAIVDANVRMFGYKGWAEGVDVPRSAEGPNFRGFATRTNASGEFRFEAPVPTVATVHLKVHPDRFHDSVWLRFSTAGRDVQPPIVAGERDLGELRLAHTGALRGRVLDTAGNPIADAEMGIGESVSSTLQRDARTEVDGSYVIAHAPAGTYAVKAKSKEFLSAFVPGQTVVAGRDTDVADIVLAAAPTISGIVVDENGRPLEGAKLWGWPWDGGSGAGATSGPDGRFVVYLPEQDEYSLSAKLDGHRAWGTQSGAETRYQPGTRDLEVVMPAVPRTRFTVVDDETGVPIERFGLSILEENGSRSPTRIYGEKRPPPGADHAGGVAEVTARLGIDAYLVAAEGYSMAKGDVEHDVEGVPAQTVRMQRAGGVRGRVVRDGSASAATDVEIVRLSITGQRRSSSGEDDKRPDFVDGNTRRSARADAEGRFTLTAIEPGDHRLTVRPASGAPLVLRRVNIPASGFLDLGDLELVPGGTIAGTLVLPDGIDLAGHTIVLDDYTDERRAIVDGKGAFRFEDVPAGVHFLAPSQRAGVLARSDPVRVEVASGETASVTLDARDRAMCAVDLRIVLDGIPVQGVQVDLIPKSKPQERVPLGQCDESGRVRGSVRALGAASVSLYIPGGRTVKHPDAVVVIPPQGDVHAVVHFDFARLEVRLPASTEFPRDGTLELLFDAPNTGLASMGVSFQFANGALVTDTKLCGVKGNHVAVEALVPGSYWLSVSLFDAKDKAVVTPTADGGVHVERKSYFHTTREIVLVAGRKLEVEL